MSVAYGDVWVGIDLGTQSVRALVVSATGEILGSGKHPLTSRREAPVTSKTPARGGRGRYGLP